LNSREGFFLKKNQIFKKISGNTKILKKKKKKSNRKFNG